MRSPFANLATANNSGNTLATARDITFRSNSATFKDFIGSGDLNDYYRFSVASSSRLNLNLDGLSADANLELLNSSGDVIQSSANSGSSAESIRSDLNGGTYYIRVFPNGSASTGYNLKVSATQLIIPDQDPSSGFQNPFSLNVGSNPITVKESSYGNYGRFFTIDRDTYSFTLNQTSNLKLGFDLSMSSPGTPKALMELTDSNGQNISIKSVSDSQSMSYALSAGTYYIRLSDNSQLNYPASSNSSLLHSQI